MVPGGKFSFLAAVMADCASRFPFAGPSGACLNSLLSRPRYKTRKPNPKSRKEFRLPSQVVVLSPGGGLSQ